MSFSKKTLLKNEVIKLLNKGIKASGTFLEFNPPIPVKGGTLLPRNGSCGRETPYIVLKDSSIIKLKKEGRGCYIAFFKDENVLSQTSHGKPLVYEDGAMSLQSDISIASLPVEVLEDLKSRIPWA